MSPMLNVEQAPSASAAIAPIKECVSSVTESADFFSIILEDCRDQLLWDARRITHNSEDAEDIVQEALMRAWRSLAQFRGDAQIVTWLRAIVRNTAREWLRCCGPWVMVPIAVSSTDTDETVVHELKDHGPGPEDHCARMEMQRFLHEEIESLSIVSRRAIEICALEEHSIRHAADMLNVDVVTIKSRLFRGRQWLQRGMCQRTGGRVYCHIP